MRRSTHRVRGDLVYEEPKTRRSQRTLALPMPLVAAFTGTARPSSASMLAGSDWHDEDLVFAQPNGRPIDGKSDHADWAQVLQAAGVRPGGTTDGTPPRRSC